MPEPDAVARPLEPDSGHVVPLRRELGLILARTVLNAWNDGVLTHAAAAAFWQTLSLPPLLMAVLGGVGFVSDWLGPGVLDAIHRNLVSLSWAVFSPNVVNGIIAPTIADILDKGQGVVASGGLLLLLWAGSSALASLVNSITIAHRQGSVRHTAWQRILTLLLYVVGVVLAVVGLPIIALGPSWLLGLVPPPWKDQLAHVLPLLYYPVIVAGLLVALTTLYHLAVPNRPPWHRSIPGAVLAVLVFVCASVGLRIYLRWVGGTGYTYGALAAPIAFLLLAYFLGLAVILGAELNHAIEQTRPALTPPDNQPPHHPRRALHHLQQPEPPDPSDSCPSCDPPPEHPHPA